MTDKTIHDKVAQATPGQIRDILVPRQKWSGRIAGSSFYRIPSVLSFEIQPSPINPILKGSGLDRKLPGKKGRKLHESNNKLNKYMEARIKSMRKALAVGRPDIFWAMVQKEMLYSTAFRLSAFNTVLKGWYKEIPAERLYQILFGIQLILKKEFRELKYFRVNIPKASPEEIQKFFEDNPGGKWPGKTRPLGVPTAPWRVVLHLWNGFLTLFLEAELKKFNHAYMPGVGTKTALKDWVERVLSAKYVYEFDIKGFFNNVSIPKVIQMLKARGMTDDMRDHLSVILQKAPENMTFKAADEILSTPYDESLAMRNWLDDDDTDEWARRDFWMSGRGAQMGVTRGLPQGAAPSTILSILALADWYVEVKRRGMDLVMYADDGFLISDSPFHAEPPRGFDFALEKSRWVKYEDSWKVDSLVFLGLKYDTRSELLEGHTRSGSRLQFGKDQLEVLEWIHTQKQGQGSKITLMEALVNSGIWGLTLSKLYGGKFGSQDYPENQEYNVDSWWDKQFGLSQLKKDRGLQRVASTIACEWLEKLIDRSKNKSIKKAKQWLRKGQTLWASLTAPERTARRNLLAEGRHRILLRDLIKAVEWDEFWDRRNRSLVIVEPVQHSLDSVSGRASLLTKVVREGLRESLSKYEDPRLRYLPVGAPKPRRKSSSKKT